MAEHLLTSLTTIVLAIIGVAIIAILVSRSGSDFLGAGSSALSRSLSTALSPISGGGLFGGFTGNPPGFNFQF